MVPVGNVATSAWLAEGGDPAEDLVAAERARDLGQVG
jgi:hypothetical protein